MDSQYERRPGMSAGQLGGLVLNLLTVIVVLTTAVVGITFLALFINPYMGINPYPPPTLPPTLGSPTPTNTAAVTLPPTWTRTPTSISAATETPQPTEAVTETLEPTETEVAEELPFALSVGSPARIQNFVNEAGCDWMGVGGQVFNLEGEPIIDLEVHLAGELEGLEPIDIYAITGSAPELGPGGYLFNVADKPIASQGTLWIQLDDGSGNPLSEQVFLVTSEDCNENQVLVNWRQVR